MKAHGWTLVTFVGFALMLLSSLTVQRETAASPVVDGLMYVGEGEPDEGAVGLQYVKAQLRFLPARQNARAFAQMARGQGRDVEMSFRLASREKVILYPKFGDDFTPDMLASGRLPVPGEREVVDGAYATHTDEVVVAGRPFVVVGVLGEEVVLFLDSYLIPDDPVHAELFDAEDRDVESAYVVRASLAELREPEMQKRLSSAFLDQRFSVWRGTVRTPGGPFFAFVGGMALLVLGGSVSLTRLCCFLAERVRPAVLGAPLAAIQKRKRLFLTLLLIYFGAVVLFTVVVYQAPELQHFIWAQVSLGLKKGPLAPVVKAYASKNIVRAAVLTLGINFGLGSIAVITLPSLVLPGVGALMALVRASMWGLLLAPTGTELLQGML
ncbi:MAG: hypothetical protein AMJ77_06860, partial [Dehalococcoidia bacterium SM23_28_2]